MRNKKLGAAGEYKHSQCVWQRRPNYDRNAA